MKSVFSFKNGFSGKSKEKPTARNETEPKGVFVDSQIGYWKPLPPLPLDINKRVPPLLPPDANKGELPLQVSRGPGDMNPLRASPAPPSYQQNLFLFGSKEK